LPPGGDPYREADDRDTYSLEQGQDEFFFALPYDKMDMVLYGLIHGMPAARVAEETGLNGGPGRACLSGHPDQAEDDAPRPHEAGPDGTGTGD
jgi:NH3-dependent NAD+ synthetase